MVKIREAGPEARARLIRKGQGAEAYQLRAPLREAIAALQGEDTIELERDERETLRQVKRGARRAAREVGREIDYGETHEGTLLVWLGAPIRRRKRRRGGAQEQATDSPTPQEELLP